MKDKLTCYIIDDEPLAQEILEEYIKKVPFLKLIRSCSSALEASQHIKNDNPDLLFLDIEMPDLHGLSLIPMLNPKPIIILTTAYDEFALKGYELEVNDYLLKPISFERFYKGILKVFQNQQQPFSEPAKKEKDYIFVKTGQKIQRLTLDDILFIEGMKDYLRIHTKKDKIMTLLSFSKLDEMLPDQDFIRVHKSFMVSLSKIDNVERNRIYIQDHIIPVSDTYKEIFYKRLER